MCFYSPSGVVDQIIPALAGVGDPGGAVLRQIPVPPSMRGRRYGELFRSLTLSHGFVPLGLYRAKGGAAGVLSYVHTAPPPDTVLSDGDKIFVLRPLKKPISRRNGGAAAAAVPQQQQQQSASSPPSPAAVAAADGASASGAADQQRGTAGSRR